VSTLEAALIVAVVVLVGLPVTYVQIRRAQRHDAARDRIIHASVLSTEGAREVDELELLFSLPAHDPVWEAGCERLWDAIRDEQQKGES
jgi:hypothetical protein